MKRIAGRPHYYRNNKGYIYYNRSISIGGVQQRITAKNYGDWIIKKDAAIEAYENRDKYIPEFDKTSTFKDVAGAFLEASQSYKVLTFVRRKRYWDKWILPALENTVVAKLKSSDVATLYKEVEDKSGIRQVIELHNVLNVFLNWAVDESIIEVNPISKALVKKIKRVLRLNTAEQRVTELDESISLNDVKRLLAAVEGTKQELPIHFQVLHGCRISEALAISYEDIDYDNDSLTIRKQTVSVPLHKIAGTKFSAEIKDRTSIRSVKTKESVRTVPLHPKTKELLLKVPETKRTGLVFKTNKDTFMSYRNWDSRHFKPLVRKLGLSITKSHTLRKFYVSYLIDSGANPALVSKWVGHIDIQTTLKHYTKPITETKDKNIELLRKIAS